MAATNSRTLWTGAGAAGAAIVIGLAAWKAIDAASAPVALPGGNAGVPGGVVSRPAADRRGEATSPDVDASPQIGGLGPQEVPGQQDATSEKPAGPVAAADVAYVADFANGAPPEFASGGVRTTPAGGRKFLGLFGPEGTTFKQEGLPPHQFVHLTFDLLLAKSWNGTHAVWGPDVWECDLVGGPTLLRTTFGNCGFFSDNNEQSYPDTFPPPPNAVPHKAFTGALEHETLGYKQNFGGGPERTYDCSSVYRMDWTFPHAGPSLELEFKSKPKKKDKTFGILALRTQTLAGPVELTDAALAAAWDALAGSDAPAADAAVWKLVAAGARATSYLKDRVGTPPTAWPAEDAEIARLSRVRHVLEVANTDAAKAVLATLPAPDPAEAPTPTGGTSPGL